jgi:hypothetical protein
MALLGTKVLAHHKPNQRLSWSFHALNKWYISLSLQYYWCIKIIMHDTGGKCITDRFWYKHHTIPVQVIAATDCILEATHQLTAAIEGIQEAAPEKFQAIESLRHILLPPPPPPTMLNDSNVNKEQIHTWDPAICAQPMLPANATQRAPQTGRAIIDNDDAPPHPIPPLHTGSPAIIDDDDDAPPMVPTDSSSTTHLSGIPSHQYGNPRPPDSQFLPHHQTPQISSRLLPGRSGTCGPDIRPWHRLKLLHRHHH